VPQALLRYPLRTSEIVGRIRGPLLLIHGEQDPLIPSSHSDTLKMLAPQATLMHIAGAAHNDLQDFDAYLSAFARALADL
jgi:pimeloyl-ACP methyl ester carboxylesterase